MTNTQLNEKINHLLKQGKPEFTRMIEKAINSQALDIKGAEDNFLLPKIILAAVYSEMSFQYMPLDKQAKKTVNNLKIFL